jgi:hypothetical protein
MNDPKLIAQLQAYNLTAALDYALEPQAPSRKGTPQPPVSQRSPQKPGSGKTTPPKTSAALHPATPNTAKKP